MLCRTSRGAAVLTRCSLAPVNALWIRQEALAQRLDQMILEGPFRPGGTVVAHWQGWARCRQCPGALVCVHRLEEPQGLPCSIVPGIWVRSVDLVPTRTDVAVQGHRGMNPLVMSCVPL